MFISKVIIIYYILYFRLLFYRLWYSLILLFTNSLCIYIIIILVENKIIGFSIILKIFLCFFVLYIYIYYIVRIYYGSVNVLNKPHFICLFKLLIIQFKKFLLFINILFFNLIYWKHENLLYLAKTT